MTQKQINALNSALSQEDTQIFAQTLKDLTVDSKITLPEDAKSLNFFTVKKALKQLGLSFKIKLKK